MSADTRLTRRGFAGGLMLLGMGTAARAQGFAGLGSAATGFAPVVPGRQLTFPADHGPHPDFRIEWWYLTANLTGADGRAYGAQWTLFRQAMAPGPQREGWANQQIWMGHAAVTSADTHRYAESFARGGVGQAGVTATPFRAWIDAWQMRGGAAMAAMTLSPLDVAAAGADFSYALKLTAEQKLVLQGDHGYSKKSERGQASYYYSQPYFTASGQLTIDNKPIAVTGQAWMDREWSSQPLASDQTGWDWFSLHLQSGDKLMLFRLRQADGRNYFAGNRIGRDGQSTPLPADSIAIDPTDFTMSGERRLPTGWRIRLPGLAIETTPLNPHSWMGTAFPYWEGPIVFSGSQSGKGYLEMTGY
ncbi:MULTISPECIES: lipocalin-like domain-containing protein [Rhodopseudomonas]|uniref:Iron ABC transporter permease n=1 Tax=Rhodopseudomonas palustris TaxID=1076 RepID=A0A0D7F3I7_RHOPL|nr:MULTISPECIES: lipocalin-like domain-containing protein [Rhodopseudomonas]KIZ47624.1 iron ABC transporter permease [Rhodopseudomonas palustris]MDF3811521.1 lipocalin-like domain-containing protein [Rhodopseudomonas sp. BAL398]WOK16161.1 lipocalin-like domain-containing protein [Rhodopseudomonas sp. BAL398]